MRSASFLEAEGVAERSLPREDTEMAAICRPERGPLAEPNCADTPVSDLQRPDRETIKSYCLSPSLKYFGGFPGGISGK